MRFLEEVMKSDKVYRILSLVLVLVGGIGLLWAAYEAMQSAWLRALVLCFLALIFWHMSASYARIGLAAERKNK